MKIISSFFITCIVTFVISSALAGVLYLLHIDLITANDKLLEPLVGGILSLFLIPAIYVLIFLPIYLLNKKEFLEWEILVTYQHYLFIVLVPFLIVSFFSLSLLIESTYAKTLLLQLFVSSQMGFYVFIKTIK